MPFRHRDGGSQCDFFLFLRSFRTHKPISNGRNSISLFDGTILRTNMSPLKVFFSSPSAIIVRKRRYILGIGALYCGKKRKRKKGKGTSCKIDFYWHIEDVTFILNFIQRKAIPPQLIAFEWNHIDSVRAFNLVNLVRHAHTNSWMAFPGKCVFSMALSPHKSAPLADQIIRS